MDPSTLINALESLTDFLKGAPPLLVFLAVVLLPLSGFPASPLYMLSGGIWGLSGGCFVAGVATIISLALSHRIGRSFLSPVLERLLRARSITIPKVSSRNQLIIILIVRFTPGVPFALQNYLLALAGVPFGPFMLVSVPINCAFVAGFILMGDSLFSGEIGGILMATAVLLGISLLSRSVAERIRARHSIEGNSRATGLNTPALTDVSDNGPTQPAETKATTHSTR